MEHNKNDILRKFPSIYEILKNKDVKLLSKAFSYNFVKERLNALIKREKDNVLNLLNMETAETGNIDEERFKVEYFAGKLKNDLNNFSFNPFFNIF